MEGLELTLRREAHVSYHTKLSHPQLSLYWPFSFSQTFWGMCASIETWGMAVKQKGARIKHMWMSILKLYNHAYCVEIPMFICMNNWVCWQTVQVLGLLISVLSSPGRTLWRKGSFFLAQRSKDSHSPHRHLSHIFVFMHIIHRWAESGAVLGSDAQLAKHGWQVGCCCWLPCWCHGDQLWSISVHEHLPGTMQASQ